MILEQRPQLLSWPCAQDSEYRQVVVVCRRSPRSLQADGGLQGMQEVFERRCGVSGREDRVQVPEDRQFSIGVAVPVLGVVLHQSLRGCVRRGHAEIDRSPGAHQNGSIAAESPRDSYTPVHHSSSSSAQTGSTGRGNRVSIAAHERSLRPLQPAFASTPRPTRVNTWCHVHESW